MNEESPVRKKEREKQEEIQRDGKSGREKKRGQ